MKYFKISIFTLFTFIISSIVFAQDNLVEVTNIYAEEIQVAGFTLTSEQSVSVEATTITPRRNHRDFHFSYAWILNSDSREMVWELSEVDPEDRSRYLMTYEAEVNLEPGTYEVYYSTYPHFNFEDDFYFHWGAKGYFSGVFNELLDDDDDNNDKEKYKFFDDLYDQLYFRVKATGTKLSADDIEEKQNAKKDNAFLSYTLLRDDEFEEQIFKVTKSVEVEIYALGEARRDGEYDYGAIMNLKTRERVWELSYRRSDHAGGNTKNRISRTKIELEPGIYKALYVTDDSHSYRRWNTAPPFDPSFWGMTVWEVTPGEKSALVKLDSDEDLNQALVVEFTKVRDEEYLSQGFTLKKSLNLHIYALGEGDDGDMYDYGWIVNTKTREKVWMMDYDDTEQAGGASKNRVFDGIVKLEPGNYMVYYITDGSHAYHSWNMSAPLDKKKWGITVSVLDDNYKEGDIAAYEEEEDESILARVVRVRDHERKKSKFSLEQNSHIHVYAIGEGDDGEMYDYAWIENVNTGRVVWEMTFRKTERAGGARKNRLFDDRVFLEAGDYVVYYETDDSHSFNDWNDRPPRDPFNWGVTISKLENGN
jgi:hypothetical protein